MLIGDDALALQIIIQWGTPNLNELLELYSGAGLRGLQRNTRLTQIFGKKSRKGYYEILRPLSNATWDHIQRNFIGGRLFGLVLDLGRVFQADEKVVPTVKGSKLPLYRPNPNEWKKKKGNRVPELLFAKVCAPKAANFLVAVELAGTGDSSLLTPIWSKFRRQVGLTKRGRGLSNNTIEQPPDVMVRLYPTDDGFIFVEENAKQEKPSQEVEVYRYLIPECELNKLCRPIEGGSFRAWKSPPGIGYLFLYDVTQAHISSLPVSFGHDVLGIKLPHLRDKNGKETRKSQVRDIEGHNDRDDDKFESGIHALHDLWLVKFWWIVTNFVVRMDGDKGKKEWKDRTRFEIATHQINLEQTGFGFLLEGLYHDLSGRSSAVAQPQPPRSRNLVDWARRSVKTTDLTERVLPVGRLDAYWALLAPTEASSPA